MRAIGNVIKKFFVKLLLLTFKICGYDDKLVLFGAMNGLYYGDNSKHLYEWLLAYRTDLSPVWLTKNRVVYKELTKEDKPVAMITSLAGIKYLARAKIGFFTNSLNDIALNAFCVPNSINLIALRHGRSVKRVRFARLKDTISLTEKHEREHEARFICFAISTSEFISNIQEKCLKIGKDKHLTTGYPRNDVLFNIPTKVEEFWNNYLGNLKPQKVILYAPSWRHGREATRFFPFVDFDKEHLTSFLEERGILLLFRPHVNDFRRYPELVTFLSELAEASAFVRIASHDVFSDVNLLLPFIDVLITDYSALYHDFLLLDRQLMFIPYDYCEFEKQNGFLYDYFECLPGAAIYTFKDFCIEIDRICIGEDVYKVQRRNLVDLIHEYQDSDSCKRVSVLIDDILRLNG